MTGTAPNPSSEEAQAHQDESRPDEVSRRNRTDALDAKLDEALEETFPASDPIAPIEEAGA